MEYLVIRLFLIPNTLGIIMINGLQIKPGHTKRTKQKNKLKNKISKTLEILFLVNKYFIFENLI